MKGLVEAIEKENMKAEVPVFNVGDTVKVGFKVIEGTKERIQNFEAQNYFRAVLPYYI